MKRVALTLCALLTLGGLASASDAAMGEKLGDDYKSASPKDKCIKIAVAYADKVFKGSKETRAAQAAIDEIFLAYVNKGETSEAKLKLLGELRKQTETECKALNDARRKENKKAPYVRHKEPNSNLQLAVLQSYVVDAAGPTPSLDKLGCLKLVRECTSWFANNSLVLAYLSEALARDEAYAKADHAGKLTIIRDLAVDKKLMSDQERKYLGKAVLSDWMTHELKGGKTADQLIDAVKGLGKKGMICFFTRSWAEGILKQLKLVR